MTLISKASLVGTVRIKTEYIFSSELFRYAVASFFALSIDTGLLVVLTSIAHIYYLLSAFIGFFAGITVTYILSVRYVFKRRTFSHSKQRELALFIIIGIVGLLLNEMILWISTGIFGIYYLISKIFSAFIVFAWNYIARKLLLFQ